MWVIWFTKRHTPLKFKDEQIPSETGGRKLGEKRKIIMSKILNEFKTYLKLKDIRSVDNFIASVTEYLNYLSENHQNYESVTDKICDEYKTFLVTQDKDLSRGTINNKLNRIKAFYSFLVNKNYCYSNPFYTKTNLKTGKILPKSILTVSDIGKLLNHFAVVTKNDLMLKTLSELLYAAALRISEAVSLKVSDIDFETGTLKVYEHKTDTARKTYLNEVCLRNLKSYIKIFKITGYLFPQKQKTTIRCMLNRKLKWECKRLDLKLITSHSFRHSVATHILRSGAGIREVQEFLGHKNIRNTEIYTHVVKDDLKNIIAKHHPREARNG
ncbi:tyrosine-type recombinase/integrase [Candidatus Woesearchaeota archaeon]|nr:tyrosine-type recombinase/integrase [Candidatus Woesearchaeota archaeon]